MKKKWMFLAVLRGVKLIMYVNKILAGGSLVAQVSLVV